MELKGILQVGESVSITCCTSVTDLTFDGESLYQALENLFNQDASDYWEDSSTQSPSYGVRYIVLDTPPEKEVSFNDLSAEIQLNMMYAEHVNGCYSEYTCGYGGFDYVLGSNGFGHSVFEELKDHVGKYVYFTI